MKNRLILVVLFALISFAVFAQETNNVQPTTPTVTDEINPATPKAEEQPVVNPTDGKDNVAIVPNAEDLIAQVDTLLKATVDTLTEQLTTLEAAINKIKDQINNDADSTDHVGTISIPKSLKIPLYNSCDSSSDSVTIKEVIIDVVDGMLREIKIHSEDGKIFANKVFISVPRFDKYRDNHFYNIYNRGRCNQANNVNEYIKLRDILDYTSKPGHNYSPSKKTITLNADKKKDKLEVKSGLNSYIDFKTYTDVFALTEKEPNGLIQAEAEAKIICNTVQFTHTNLFLFNYIEPSIRFSKFDNDFAILKMDSSSIASDTLLEIDRTQLYQLSKIDIGIKMNLAKWFLRRKDAKIELNAFSNYFYSDIQFLEEERQTANFTTFGLETELTIPRYKNFGLDISSSIFWQHLIKKVGYDEELFKEFTTRGTDFFISPSFELYYFPLKNEDNKVYLRFQTFNNISVAEKGFNQFQIGYKTRIKLN